MVAVVVIVENESGVGMKKWQDARYFSGCDNTQNSIVLQYFLLISLFLLNLHYLKVICRGRKSISAWERRGTNLPLRH
jgi:uncharacterized membrane protein